MSIHAVIFDLDGTLVDTLDDITGAINRALTRAGLPPISREQCRRRVGWGLRELARRSLPEDSRDPERLDAIAADFESAYRKDPVAESRPYAGIPALLDSIRDATIKTAVLSNKPDELVHAVVDALFGRNRFGYVLGGTSDHPRKPDPATTTMILDTLGVSAEKTLFVGDSEIDIATARNAGCIPVGVSWGYRDVELLRASGAAHICYSTEEIRELLGLQRQREDLG